MLKNLMLIYVIIVSAFRSVNLILTFNSGVINLPIVVLVFTVITILIGIYVIIKAIIRKLNIFDLSFYACINLIVVVFNLLFISYTLPTQLQLTEKLMVGSLLDVIVCVAFLYQSFNLARKAFSKIKKENL